MTIKGGGHRPNDTSLDEARRVALLIQKDISDVASKLEGHVQTVKAAFLGAGIAFAGVGGAPIPTSPNHVYLNMPSSIFTVSGSPVDGSGTLEVTLQSQTKNLFLASPDGVDGVPTMRAIAVPDLPDSGVAADTYGEDTYAPILVVDTKGRITSASTSTVELVQVLRLADQTSATLYGSSLVGFHQVGSGAVGMTLASKAQQIVNIKDFGASASASKATNAAAMQLAIAAVDAAGGGVVVVDRDINYGYKRIVTDGSGTWDGQPNVWPDFSACVNDVEVWDSSIGNTYGTGLLGTSHDGSQFRRWQSTHDATLGNTDGNTQWIRGAWAPSLTISNDSRVNNTSSVNAYDNRRCGIFFNNDGVATWGISQGTLTGIGYTEDELSTFTIKANGLSGIMPPTTHGAITSVFTLSKKTGGFAFNSGTPDTYAGFFGARAGVSPSFVFDGETAIDPSTLFAAGTGHVDDGSGIPSPGAGTILTITAINPVGTTAFAALQTVIMSGLGEGVTISSQLTGTPGGIGTYQLSGLSAPITLGSRGVTAGTTTIAGEPTIMLRNGYSESAAPYSKIILKNLNVTGQTYPGWGLRVDGEFHGMVQSFFNVSDSSHQIILSSLTNAGPDTLAGSIGLYALGDRHTTSTSGSTTGGSYDWLKVFNSKNTESLNIKFLDAGTMEVSTNGTGAQIVWADATQSTSTITGAHIFKGGAAFQKNLYGTAANFSGTVTAGSIASAGASFTSLVTITVASSNSQLRLVRTTSSAGTVNVFANAAGTGSTDTFNVTDGSNATIFQATLTGATITGALTAGITTAPSFATSGTAGLGFIDLNAQSAAPSIPASNHIRIHSDATGRLAWKRSDGFVRTFASTLTADRVWTWPDVAGTVVTTGNLTDITATGTIASGTWHGTTIGVQYGGTGADLSLTGGASKVLMQVSAGAAVTVAQLAFTDISGSVAAAQMPALTGDVTSAAGTVATTIANNAVTLAKMATVATASFLGRTTTGTGNVEALTATQATALLNAMVGDSGSGGTKGLVPTPASGDSAKYLKGDGTWGTPTVSVLGIRAGSMIWSNTNTVTISNATASVFGTGGTGATLTLPVGFFQTGAVLHIKGWGIYSTGSATPTIAMTLTLGGSTIATLSANALSTSVSSKYFEFEAELTIRTVSGSAVVPGTVSYKGFTATTTVNVGGSSQASNSAATNAAAAFDLTITAAAGTGTTTFTLHQVAAFIY